MPRLNEFGWFSGGVPFTGELTSKWLKQKKKQAREVPEIRVSNTQMPIPIIGQKTILRDSLMQNFMSNYPDLKGFGPPRQTEFIPTPQGEAGVSREIKGSRRKKNKRRQK